MEERADAAGDREDPENEAERRERHAVTVGEEEVHEREEAAGAEPEEDLDGQEATDEVVARWRREGVLGHGHGTDREDRDDRCGRDETPAPDEGAEHECVVWPSAEQRGHRRRKRTRDHARKERGRRTERDLLTEARGAPRRISRVREERGARRARDDAAEADKHRREEDRWERVENQDPEDADPCERAAEENRGAA